jgi:hypothetical protein
MDLAEIDHLNTELVWYSDSQRLTLKLLRTAVARTTKHVLYRYVVTETGWTYEKQDSLSTSCFCISIPPMSEYEMSGFSSGCSMEMDESASGGRTST